MLESWSLREINRKRAAVVVAGLLALNGALIATKELTSKSKSPPIYGCKSIGVYEHDGDPHTIEALANIEDAQDMKVVTFNFGDGSEDFTQYNTSIHHYAENGTYTIEATPHYKIGGRIVSAICQKVVEIPFSR